MTIKLPDIPTPKDFASQAQYGLALDMWLQACKTVVAGNVAVIGKHEEKADWIHEAALKIYDEYPSVLARCTTDTRMPWLCAVIREAVEGK